MNRTPRGFTLIELLVVITIIGLLIGLLMPALRRAREHGWSVKCKVNLRNLQVACINHATDHNGALPHAGSFEIEQDMDGSERWHSTTGWVHWVGYPEYPDDQNYHDESHENDNDVITPWWGDDAIQSLETGTLWDYMGHQRKAYLCPRFASSLWSGGNSPAADGGADDGPPIRSYVMNSYFHDRDNKSWGHKNFLHQQAVSKRLLFADSQPDETFETQEFDRWFKRTGNDLEARRSWDGSLNPGSDTNNPTEAIGTLHFGLGNAVFLDGHVEALTWSNTVDHCQATW